jgi:Uma2 family endonuclease
LNELFHAPFDVVLDEPANKNTFQPDILFIYKERLEIIEKQRINGAPDLAVEILSPSTTRRDRVEKSRIYYKYGVKEYWIVDPDAKIVEVFTPGEKKWILHEAYHNDEILTSPLLPGLQINLVDVF